MQYNFILLQNWLNPSKHGLLFYLSAIHVRWKPEILGSFFNIILETDAEKIDWLKIWLLVKNPQFLSNQADLQASLPTHELKI